MTSDAGQRHAGLLLLALCSTKHLVSLVSEELSELLVELLVASCCLQANSKLNMALHIHVIRHKQHADKSDNSHQTAAHHRHLQTVSLTAINKLTLSTTLLGTIEVTT